MTAGMAELTPKPFHGCQTDQEVFFSATPSFFCLAWCSLRLSTGPPFGPFEECEHIQCRLPSSSMADHQDVHSKAPQTWQEARSTFFMGAEGGRPGMATQEAAPTKPERATRRACC